ncbi:MAG: hypothetical protein ACN6O2_17285, partial [Stenotrophomonas sp.]
IRAAAAVQSRGKLGVQDRSLRVVLPVNVEAAAWLPASRPSDYPDGGGDAKRGGWPGGPSVIDSRHICNAEFTSWWKYSMENISRWK